ncbi:interleukin-23 subunit alpha-like [Conger conger]|uniref:interleukin-23 subunit alpha-like n=1 Tax=Conger conger TaxID=82655 RepID=UPI002A5AADAF|nr:interleukin-23 subunit alpha-like [Conger conger]
MQVLGGSRWLDNIGERVVLVEPSDMCDPAGLKTDSKPCLQKLITALGNYSRIFQMEDLFVGSEREMAQKVVVKVTELLGQLGAKEPQGPATKHQAWMQQSLARYSAQRLLSFSVIVARVFAAGNPAAHGNAPPTSCHQS